MATRKDLEALVAAVTRSVDETVRYFQGTAGNARVMVGQWGPRETFGHFLFWHEATAQGMESVAGGGPPFQVAAPVDEINAQVLAGQADRSLPELIGEVPRLHKRLVRAVRALPDLDATVLVFADGNARSGQQRLQMIADHWREHVTAIESATDP